MIRIECDKCKKDCDKFAYDITMQVIQNPTPCTHNEVGRLEITHDRTTKRFLLCAECAMKLGLPNVYEDGVKFRDGADKEYDVKAITRGNCMACGKELTEGVFFCKECEEKGRQGGVEK